MLRQQLGQAPIFNHITPEWVRYDLTVETPDDVIKRSQTTTLPLFDKTDLTATMRPFGDPLTPNAHDIERLTTEFLRVLGLLPVVIGRGEHVVGMSGAGLLRSLLIQLMLEDVAVEDRGGALRLAGVLPYDRLEELAALPASDAAAVRKRNSSRRSVNVTFSAHHRFRTLR